MIQRQEQIKLEELKAQVKCPKGFICIGALVDDLCKARYHAHLGILECLEQRPVSCTFARPVRSAFACACPLRIYIAQHFDQWSDDSTMILRQGLI